MLWKYHIGAPFMLLLVVDVHDDSTCILIPKHPAVIQIGTLPIATSEWPERSQCPQIGRQYEI